MFFKKKEHKIRGIILKGVYEENLKILGKETAAISRRMPLTLKKSFLSLSFIFFIVFGFRNFTDTASFQENRDYGSSMQKSSLQPAVSKAFQADAVVNATDLQKFLGVPERSLSRTFGLKVKTIMIDPGHGGSDPGSIGKGGMKEKDITLDIAKRLKGRLQKYTDFKVVLTREEDATMHLEKRVALARAQKADLFISIHFNSLPSKPINIIETYYFGLSSDEQSVKLAEKENAGSQVGLSEFRKIIEQMGDTMKFQESKSLAALMQKSLFTNIRKLDGQARDFGIKKGPFFVLLGVDVPAVLTEVACLSNSEEEKELNTEKHKNNIAYYLETGIIEYLKNKGERIHEAKR